METLILFWNKHLKRVILCVVKIYHTILDVLDFWLLITHFYTKINCICVWDIYIHSSFNLCLPILCWNRTWLYGFVDAVSRITWLPQRKFKYKLYPWPSSQKIHLSCIFEIFPFITFVSPREKTLIEDCCLKNA